MIKKIIWCVVIILVILFPNPYPNVHGNTDKAIRWCADGGSDVGDPSCAGALGKCIDDYLDAHNLTDKELPTYVWLNAGHQYDKIFPHECFILIKLVVMVFIMGIIYIKI